MVIGLPRAPRPYAGPAPPPHAGPASRPATRPRVLPLQLLALLIVLLALLPLASSSSSSFSAAKGAAAAPAAPAPAAAAGWARVDAVLDAYANYTAFGIVIGNASGTVHTYAKGGFDLDAPVALASASKWVTAAIVFRVIERTAHRLRPLTLQSRVRDWVPAWATVPANDPRSAITLAHLLSMTSGMDALPCGELGSANMYTSEACIDELTQAYDVAGGAPIARALPYTPGRAFYYAGSHLQLAAAMAARAAGYMGRDAWQRLVNAELRDHFGFPKTVAYQPATNPLAAGGLRASARQFATWMHAYFTGAYVGAASMAAMEANQLPADVVLANLPIPAWRYGYGLWMECRVNSPRTTDADADADADAAAVCNSSNATVCTSPSMPVWTDAACASSCEYSSIGHYGAYPYMQRCGIPGAPDGYYAVVVTAQGDPASSLYLGDDLWPAIREAFIASV